ncbi:MAG: acylphosphatase [Candidatus Aenigmatarchaeota archaeon]
MKRCHIFVSGRVQGVFYRDFTRRNALELGLSGWVKNLDDGRVELVAEGGEDKLNELITLLKKGPISARIGNLEIVWEMVKNEVGFEIHY